MISIIINAYKEATTIGKAIRCLADSKYSGITTEYELIQVSPDQETLLAGKDMAQSLGISKRFKQIVDPRKGKPYALNMALKNAKGDILILTDGDVFFGKNAGKELLKHFSNPNVGGVTGRPRSLNARNNMMGYLSHLLTDAAHDKRSKVKKFFPMSGYCMATRKDFNLPIDMLSDDAYISYDLANKGYDIIYEPKAEVFVKFPSNLNDYFKQKIRSLGGNIQLKRSGVMNKLGETRSFLHEIKYLFFVLSYAKNFREFFWSILLFPIRLMTWILIVIKRIVLKKGMPESGWERIESTK